VKINKFKFINSILSIFLGLNYSLPVQGQNILEEIQKTGLLKVGIRSDAVPFGYRDNNRELRGICFDFVALLRKELIKKIERNIITVKIVISTLYNRFEIVEDNLVYLECGPNTIREIPEYNVEFSDAFFLTGIQLLIKKDLAENIKNYQNLRDLKVGVLRYTTAEKFIKNKYPDVNIELFQGVKGSLRAIQAVQQGRIDSFANDAILLIGESILLQLPLNEKYTLIPKKPLTCEKYGLIIPDNDPLWRDFVNSVIDSAQEKEIAKEWLSVLADELQKTEEFCHSEPPKR
jgi:polar amino acid transport system substrate-binding protein